MDRVEQDLYTVCVFKDVDAAERGVSALQAEGFDPGGVSVLAKVAPATTAFVERLAPAPQALTLTLPVLGACVARGELVACLQGPKQDLASVGVAGTMRRAGFQAHDGMIYERLLDKGGVMVAVCGAPRAADALAVMLNRSGGNAAIGAWVGRV